MIKKIEQRILNGNIECTKQNCKIVLSGDN